MSDIRSFRDYEDGKFIFGRTQDCEPIVEHNKALQNEPVKRADTFRHVASIPAVILEKWIIEEDLPLLSCSKQEFARLIKRKLKDPDWRWLRTSPGAI